MRERDAGRRRVWITGLGSLVVALFAGCADEPEITRPSDAGWDEDALIERWDPVRFASLLGDTLEGCPDVDACQAIDDPGSTGKLCMCELAGILVNAEDPPTDTAPSWPDPPGWYPYVDPNPGGGGPGGECEWGCPVPATPRLVCSTNVERGGNATCTVSVESDNAYLEHVYRWVFQPDFGGTPIVKQPGGSDTWSGTVVTSGDVRVVIRVGGSDIVLASRIRVTPRSWSWGPGDWTFSAGLAPLPSGGEQAPFYQFVVTGGIRMGWNCSMPTQAACDDYRFMRPDYLNGETGGFTTGSVGSGPNTGLHYVTSASFYSHRGSAVNSNLESSASPIFASTDPAQAQCSPSNWYDANDCLGGASSQALVAGILNHEAYGTTGTNGHQAFYETEAAAAQFDPNATVEGIVGRSQNEVANAVTSTVDALSANLQAAVGAKGEPTGSFPPATRWAWDFDSLYWRSTVWTGG